MRVIVHSQIAPGWTVRVDGQSADIVDEDGFFLAVDIPAETHTVVFSYKPKWLKPSLVLSIVGMAAIVGLVVADGLRRSKLKAGQ